MVMGGEGYEDHPHHPQHGHLHDDDIEGTCQSGRTRSWPARQRSTWLDGLCIGDNHHERFKSRDFVESSHRHLILHLMLTACITGYDLILTLTKGTQTSWGCQEHWTEFKKW